MTLNKSAPKKEEDKHEWWLLCLDFCLRKSLQQKLKIQTELRLNVDPVVALPVWFLILSRWATWVPQAEGLQSSVVVCILGAKMPGQSGAVCSKHPMLSSILSNLSSILVYLFVHPCVCLSISTSLSPYIYMSKQIAMVCILMYLIISYKILQYHNTHIYLSTYTYKRTVFGPCRTAGPLRAVWDRLLPTEFWKDRFFDITSRLHLSLQVDSMGIPWPSAAGCHPLQAGTGCLKIMRFNLAVGGFSWFFHFFGFYGGFRWSHP
jgi:hypothetical protein